MTHDEMIAVIQAHKEGKTIQYQSKLWEKSIWEDMPEGHNNEFDFINWSYRIKPEPHYRPFKSAEEVMTAIKEHGVVLRHIDFKSHRSVISEWDDTGVWIASFANAKSFEDTFEFFTFADGTPFGKLEE